MSATHPNDEVEALAQRRFKYTHMRGQVNRQLRDKFSSAEINASNERARRQLYDGNLEPTSTPRNDEIPAYIKYLEGECEELKDPVTIDEWVDPGS